MTDLKRHIIIIYSFFLSGCLFDSVSDNVADDYEVVWTDTYETRRLNKGEQIVPAYVFAVGHNSKFIYAKQHPLIVGSKKKIDESITNYYLIERTISSYQDKPVYGPLTKLSFDSLTNILGLKELDFDMTYPTNY